MNWIKKLLEMARGEEKKSDAGYLREETDKKAGMGRNFRRRTAHDARRTGKGEAKTKACNWKAVKRKLRKLARMSRKRNRYA